MTTPQVRSAAEDRRIHKVVLTGGPCAGKTTALAYLNEKLSELGVAVYTVPEPATLMFGAGVQIGAVIGQAGIDGFQQRLIEMQMHLEDSIVRFAEMAEHTGPVVVICDRGVLDSAAYHPTPQSFDDMVHRMGLRMPELWDRYDAVFALVTAAEGAEEHYNLDNDARTETPEQARAVCRRTREAWAGHERLWVIPNVDASGGVRSFDEKLRALYRAVVGTMGMPEPLEIERKYLLRAGTAAAVEAAAGRGEIGRVVRTDITQIYLRGDDEGTERRIRVRRPVGHSDSSLEASYTYTEKREISPLVRHESSRKLTLDEFRDLERWADPERGVLNKTRYNFVVGNEYFHLDRFWDLEGIEVLEIELATEASDIVLPEILGEAVVSEVTTDPAYRNSALSRTLKSRD